MARLTTEELGQLLTDPGTISPNMVRSLVQEIELLRSKSTIARGYQMNQLQNTVHKERTKRATAYKQRKILFLAFEMISLTHRVVVDNVIKAAQLAGDRYGDPEYTELAQLLISLLERNRKKTTKAS